MAGICFALQSDHATLTHNGGLFTTSVHDHEFDIVNQESAAHRFSCFQNT